MRATESQFNNVNGNHEIHDNKMCTSIKQKFGEPGHSSIQEVNNIHSQVEKRLKGAEIFSPIKLIRILKVPTRFDTTTFIN